MKNKNNFYKQVTSAVFLVISAVFLGSVSLSALAATKIASVHVGVPGTLSVWLANNKSGSTLEGPYGGGFNFYEGDNYLYITKKNKKPDLSKHTSYCRIKITTKNVKICQSGSTNFSLPSNRQSATTYACGTGGVKGYFQMKIVDLGKNNCGSGAVFQYLGSPPWFMLAIPASAG